MRLQRLPLDRRIALSYIGACVALLACRPRLTALVPQPLPPVDRDSAVDWTRATLPLHTTAIRFRWKYQDREKRWGGRGQARIAPPDSLRFDYVGPLGLGAGAAAVVADSTIWADPEKNFRSLVPAVRMLWAGLGIARPPAAAAAVFGAGGGGGAADSSVRIWRFVQGDDTLDYRETRGESRVLEAEWRREGRIQARSRTQLDGHRMPATARIDFPEGPARFELTVVSVDTAAIFDPAIWRGRR
ncbi:MAG TPA: hypothetical protein VJN39_03220 [Gemmatimonadales bacterium]|nr:hypothetical protein [Gemmatimonadales bacterium]